MNNISDKVNSAINLFNSGEKEKGLIEINLLVISYPKNMDLLLLHAKIFRMKHSETDINDVFKVGPSYLKLDNLVEVLLGEEGGIEHQNHKLRVEYGKELQKNPNTN